METFIFSLAIAYYLVAVFYFLCGVALLARNQWVKSKIPSYFPLLHSHGWTDNKNVINLIIIGIILFIVAPLLMNNNPLGLGMALFFSLFEVFLSFAFYLKRKEYAQTWIHFIIHGAISTLIIIYIY